MDDYLNSEMFEQMAKAYNARFASVGVLKSDEINLDRIKIAFDDIHKLLSMFDTQTSREDMFVDYFDKRNKLKQEIADFAESHSIVIDENKLSPIEKIDNKTCINLLGEVIKRLFSLHNENNFETIEKFLNILLDVTLAFYSGF